MRCETLAQLLQTDGVGTVGQNIFVEFLPDAAPVPALMIRSGFMATPVDAELPDYRAGAMFQVIVRTTDIGAGYDMINAAVAALTTEQPLILQGIRYNFIRPKHEPLVYPITVGNEFELSVNFDCNYVIL